MPVCEFESNDEFDDTFDSQNAESNASVDVETSVGVEENFSPSDLSASLTNNSDENENSLASNMNSIESVDVAFDQNDDSTERPNASVDIEEATTTFTSADLVNDSNINHTESDPLAVSGELIVGDLSINDNTTAPNGNVDFENQVDSTDTSHASHVIDDTVANMVNSNITQSESNRENQTDIDGLGGLNSCGAIQIEPLPVYDNHICNDNEIDDVLGEPLEEVCDDVIIVIGRAGLPKPLRMTTEQTIKRENDRMSGNLTFSVSVRVYFVHNIYHYSILILLKKVHES